MKNFKEFTGYDWYKFILKDASNNVKICDKYKGWELLDKWDWINLLQNHPQFANKCDEYNGWELFNEYYWFKLLQVQPQFSDKCSKYNRWELFNEYYWFKLLQIYPQFVNKCNEHNGWKLFNGYHWSNLLQKQPQFADKCDEYKGWKLFGERDWLILLRSQPQFADKCYEYKGFSQFNKKDWKELIENKKTNFIFLIYDLKKYKNDIYKKHHYLLNIYDNLFKNIENFKKYTDECITTPEGFKLFIEHGIKDNRANEIIDFEKIKDFILGFEDLNILMVRNILDGLIENYKNKKERGNKR